MAGNILWAHLLRKDLVANESPSQIPPLAPLDKTGTSMRMLIHDTQANLEKFSVRLDSLLQRVEDCKAQVLNSNKLLDNERDRVLTEILDIANRCQSELKSHVGTPAQAHALDLVHVSQLSTERIVQALEKRIDALQALLQTHTHAMQSIQDQQNNILHAVLPLVPLIQSVPSQIDQIKTALSDMVSGAVSSMTKSIDGIKTTLASSELSHGQERRFVRSSTQMPSSYKTASNSRRKRSSSMAHSSSGGPQEINVAFSSPSAGRDDELRLSSSKRLRLDASTPCVAPPHLSRQLSRPAWPPTSIGSVPRRSGVVNPIAIPRTPQTPRRPLADLIPPSEPSNIRITMATQNIAELTSPLVEYMRSEETLRPSGAATLPQAVAQNSVSGPSLPWVPAQKAPNDVQDSAVSQRQPVPPVHSVDLHTTGSATPNSSSEPSKDAISKAIKVEEVLRPGSSGIFSITPSPLSPVPSPMPPQPHSNPDTTSASIIQPPTQSQVHPNETATLRSRTPRSTREVIQAPHTSSNPLSSNSDTSQPKSMSLRDRRAQMSVLGRTETRRFIPLVPWSDEEE